MKMGYTKRWRRELAAKNRAAALTIRDAKKLEGCAEVVDRGGGRRMREIKRGQFITYNGAPQHKL
jgi:hypothetical protein